MLWTAPPPASRCAKLRLLFRHRDFRFWHITEVPPASRDFRKPATAFLFKLISQLQFSGTVPMIDIQAYARWLGR